MKVKFQYTSQIAMLANCNEELIESPKDLSIQEALIKLTGKKSEEFKKMLFTERNELLPAILLIKNGTQIDFTDNELLKDGDEILIFSPMSGG